MLGICYMIIYDGIRYDNLMMYVDDNDNLYKGVR